MDDSQAPVEESVEENVQSFAEPPPPEPELSACSIDADQLNKLDNFPMLVNMSQRSINMEDPYILAQLNNSRGSFDNDFRNSFARGSIADEKVQSLLGSMVVPANMSITEHNML